MPSARRHAVTVALFVATTLAATTAAAQDAGQLNIICSVQAEWCNMIQTVFAKSTGIKVNMALKGSGEALAQLIAEPFKAMLTLMPVDLANTVWIMLHHSACTEQMMFTWPCAAAPRETPVSTAASSRCFFMESSK